MTERFRIGELARRTGRTVHAIRWYERQGLLPNVGRDAGGRRVYEQGHLEHLVFLDWLRLTGMSVAEMRKLTELGLEGWRTLDERIAMLSAHREEIAKRIADLRVALELVDAKARYYAEWAEKKKRPPPMPTPAAAREHSKARAPEKRQSARKR